MAAITDEVSVVITTAQAGGSTLGTLVNWSMGEVSAWQLLYDQGKLLPSSVGTNSRILQATLSFYCGDGAGPKARTAAVGTVAVTVRDNSGGGTKVYSLGKMKGLDWSISHNDRSPAICTQQFICIDDADTTEFTPPA